MEQAGAGCHAQGHARRRSRSLCRFARQLRRRPAARRRGCIHLARARASLAQEFPSSGRFRQGRQEGAFSAPSSFASQADPVVEQIPQHTLSQLSALLPLLAIVPSTSALGISLLTTVQFALFNLDNLRRGIARESYNAGVGPAAADDTEGAAGELLGALKAHLSTNPSSTSSGSSVAPPSVPRLLTLAPGPA